jgi:hypothetical protein
VTGLEEKIIPTVIPERGRHSREMKRDQSAFDYMDRALTPPEGKDGDRFETFTVPVTDAVRKKA